MKRIYTALTSLVLAVLLIVGIVALFSPAASAEKPKLTFAGLLNGSFFSGYRSYYAGSFTDNQTLKDANKSLNGFYHYSGLSDGDVSLILDVGNSAANHGASLKPSEGASEPTSEIDPSAPTAPTEAPTEPPTQATERINENDVAAENLGQALLVGDRAIEVPHANYDIMESYSDAVTKIATALGKDVRTFNILVPNGAEFYAPNDYHTGDTSQSKMIGFCYEKLGSNVITADAYSKLAAHTDDYIYFRTDHHWTQLGAYYAYTAFCEAADFEASDLSLFERGEYDNFLGSMYSFLSNYPQASVLANNPDTLYYYRPYVDTDTGYYEDATLSPEIPMGCISYIGSNVSNKYLTFLGGDHPITIINTDVDGPVCLLIKESYGNAFAPWLTSHYSKVIAIDPREFNRDGSPSLDLVAFAKEQNVSDCIILDYPMMISSENYVEWLNRLIS